MEYHKRKKKVCKKLQKNNYETVANQNVQQIPKEIRKEIYTTPEQRPKFLVISYLI